MAKIDTELMSVKQVSDYLGGNIGLNKINELMKKDILKTVEIGGKRQMVTRKKYVDNLIELMFLRPIDNGVIETWPRVELDRIMKNTPLTPLKRGMNKTLLKGND